MSARGRREKIRILRRVSQYSGASWHRTKEGKNRRLAEGNAGMARATYGRKVSSNCGAPKRRRKKEDSGNETQGREDEGKEGKEGEKATRRATATSRKVEKMGNDSAVA